MATIILGFWNTEGIQRIKIENVDLENKVQFFKDKVKSFKFLPDDLEFSYCGLLLEAENTFSSYGITDGVTIYVLEKSVSKPLVSGSTMTSTELINAFTRFASIINFRLALQRTARLENINKIIEICPRLAEDPAAIAILQDPELLRYLLDIKHGNDMLKNHPVLIEATYFLLKQARDELAGMNPSQVGTSTGYSYSLDALSDDDEDMDPDSEINISQYPLTRNTSFNAITAAQLADAIANATNTQFNTNSAGVPTTTSSSSSIITNEMFSNAIQRAINFGESRSPNTNTNNQEAEESFDNLSRQWQAQLKQMHEMGLIDDTVNIRALRAVNGNVNAAIELVLNVNEMV